MLPPSSKERNLKKKKKKKKLLNHPNSNQSEIKQSSESPSQTNQGSHFVRGISTPESDTQKKKQESGDKTNFICVQETHFSKLG